MDTHKGFPLITAIYLPQYYETEYNNEWWGKGYTEWTACRQAKPLFNGHNQPRVPLNNNYYDLSKRDSIKWQMELAKTYGIDGFAIYQYYSCGNKLLDIPLEMIRDDPSLDLPFFLYWANHTWRKAWFGQDETVLWEQKYGSEEDWKTQFDYCYDYFVDNRYIRLDGKPVYAIYDTSTIPNVDHVINLWNRWAKDRGLPGIFFVKTINRHLKKDLGSFSAIISREPNYTFAHSENIYEKTKRVLMGRTIKFMNRAFLLKRGKGIVMTKASYDHIWKKIIKRDVLAEHELIGAFVDWDNSPRKSYNSIIFEGVTLQKFQNYFRQLLQKANKSKTPMIVINAWNEWAEGAYLEPDTQNGFGVLESIKKAKEEATNNIGIY